MATFEARVEGLTGLSIDGSSAPTQDELTEYLKDGVIEVTERTLRLRPQDSANFTARSATQSSNGANFNGTKETISRKFLVANTTSWRCIVKPTRLFGSHCSIRRLYTSRC